VQRRERDLALRTRIAGAFDTGRRLDPADPDDVAAVDFVFHERTRSALIAAVHDPKQMIVLLPEIRRDIDRLGVAPQGLPELADAWWTSGDPKFQAGAARLIDWVHRLEDADAEPAATRPLDLAVPDELRQRAALAVRLMDAGVPDEVAVKRAETTPIPQNTSAIADERTPSETLDSAEITPPRSFAFDGRADQGIAGEGTNDDGASGEPAHQLAAIVDSPRDEESLGSKSKKSEGEIEEAKLRDIIQTGKRIFEGIFKRPSGPNKQNPDQPSSGVTRPPAELVIDAFTKRFSDSGRNKVEITAEDIAPGQPKEEAIRAFVEAWQTGRLLPPGGQHAAQLDLGRIDQSVADRIQTDTGLDVSGTRRVIDTNQLRHAMRGHGVPNAPDPQSQGRNLVGEVQPDQVPLTSETVATYLHVVENYDGKAIARQRSDGTTTIEMSKSVGDVAVVVEQLRTSEGSLAFQTMWIKKRTP
jgi:phage-Barnase-EndoU-ColicinE5/D-RelE like nuclease3